MTAKPSIKSRAMIAADLGSEPIPTVLTSEPISQSKTEKIKLPHQSKTAPGAMMQFMINESDTQRENAALKTELKLWDGSAPVKKIDPTLISNSRFANREEDSFSTYEFVQLKEEIKAADGNIQPIKVRPIPGTLPQSYEIVFGHRRHRACLELGIPVLALIESLSDTALFEEMERENRNRENLRPYEQGRMYQKALSEGLYRSQRSLGEALQLQSGNISVAINIFNLPSFVLEAFPSKLDIQYKWHPLIASALKEWPDLVQNEAKLIVADRLSGRDISPKEVLSRITSFQAQQKVKHKPLIINGKNVGFSKFSGDRYTLTLNEGVISTEQAAAFEMALSEIIYSQ